MGKTFDRSSINGRWSLCFGFVSCPDVCPTSMSVLGTVDRQLQASDPSWRNSFRAFSCQWIQSEIVREPGRYATAFSPRFLGVTGPREDFGRANDPSQCCIRKGTLDGTSTPESASADIAADAYTVDHTGNIVIINPRGHYHGFIKLPHDSETIRLTFQTLASQF